MSKISSIKERFFDVLRLIVVGNPWSYDFEADGIYYSRKGSELTVTAGKNRYCGRVVVPATVTRKNKTYNVTAIGESAFENCKELTDVVIPDSAHSIGNYAFYGCSALVSVVIGKKAMSFGERAFARCPNLRSVTIRSQNVAATSYNWLNNIPTTFGPNVKEYIIGEGVTVIGKEAFYGCFNIKSVTIPSSMKKIGKGAFSGCSDLRHFARTGVCPGDVQDKCSVEQFRHNPTDLTAPAGEMVFRSQGAKSWPQNIRVAFVAFVTKQKFFTCASSHIGAFFVRRGIPETL